MIGHQQHSTSWLSCHELLECVSQGEWNPQPDNKGRIVDWDCGVGRGPSREDVILGYHLDRSRVDTIGVKPACGDPKINEAGTWITRMERATMYRSIPFAPFSKSAVGPDGTEWCVPTTATYEILRLRPGGSDTLRIARSAPRIPVTAAERDSIIAEIDSKGPTGVDFTRIPKEKPAIDRLTVDDQARLWVRRLLGKGVLAFDIFGADGKFIASAQMAGCRTTTWLPFVVRGANVYTVCLDEDDVQFVTRFKIAK